MGFPLLHVEEPHFTGWRRVIKRLNDLVLTSVGLIIISPLMLGIAGVVKLQDGGSVIFRQRRVGCGGELFTMLKFRSMVPDAEARKVALLAYNEGNGGLFKMRDDPRITRFGRLLREFSLDELPQLFNVLAGSMSLVGPRPHLPSELAQMPSEASRRSVVTPGLTGIWQVSGRSDLEGDDAIRLDLRYVENWSSRPVLWHERLRRVRQHLDGDEIFLANYGDVLTDAPMNDLTRQFAQTDAVAQLLAVKPQDSFHVVDIEGDSAVTGLTAVASMSMRINGGYFVLRKRSTTTSRRGRIWSWMAASGLPAGSVRHCNDGFLAPMDTLKERSAPEAIHRRGNSPWALWRERPVEVGRPLMPVEETDPVLL
jgi:lipopolysaccharide/colanic/teichoic acid biosynthesis glycosyltransferase